MPSCACCGMDTDGGPPDSHYAYCDECLDLFEQIRGEGVWVRWRNNNANTLPAGYYVWDPVDGERHASSQTEALAEAQDAMENHGLPGLFEYRKSGSRWLVEDYLDAHPKIAHDVARERRTVSCSLLNWLPFGR